MDSSTNMHHHQLHEEQLVDVDESSTTASSTSLASSCFHTIVAGDDHAWRNPTFFMNTNNAGNIHANCGDNEAAPNSLNNPIIQEMGFSWPNNNNNNNNNISINHQQQLYIDDRIKEEEPSSSTSSDHHHHYHHRHHGHDDNNPNFAKKFSDLLSSSTPSSSPNEMLLLKNTLSTSYKNLHQQQPSPFPPSMPYQNPSTSSSSNNKGISTTFSQIFPSVNISNMRNNNNNMSSATTIMCSSSSGGTIDHQMASNVPGGFDLFATARLLSGETGINQCTPSNNNNLLELFEGSPQFRVDHHDLQHHSNDLKLFNNNIIANNVAVSSFNNDRSQADSKKYNVMEQQSTTQPMATKKQRFESRSSCPPLKVRKEKLGDRIAALQQLVSPFGKTDTASVLMEAIGYIKFLQNQVETLSAPYMKLASRSKSSSTQRVSNDEYYCESEEQKSTDLKSRGLCLVPTSCMSYINIASDPINSGVWPPNFNPTSGF